MDLSVWDAASQAFVILMDPFRLLMLATGVIMGLVLGLLPGIGGLAGTALLLPFTYAMDPYAAFALLLGLGATIATGDPIPAILFGIPGGAGSAATVLDGLPMAKRGEAGRALSAAYMSSLMGGIFGAILMGLAIPAMRPLILFFGSPEMLAISVFGISMVATLAGNAPLKGLAIACFGIMLAMVGSDPQTGTLRWTMGSLYLWDGLPLVPLVLGIFALPELCDLKISKAAIASVTRFDVKTGMLQGAKDCFKHWWLVLRCSWMGSAFGSIPGLGASVVDWLAYGHALKTEKGARESFGKGDVRGVIASESANNAREGGALVPTIAFGVPGSAGMAILLGVFLIHGLVPGPDMLTKNLHVTYSMVWSIALANILGAGLCYAFSGQFAKLATLRYTLMMPAILSIVFIGAYQGSRNWGDLYALLFFGMIGWTMKQLKWPRPPLILGVVLGHLIERYLFISVTRYGVEWFERPFVIVMFLLAAFALLGSFFKDWRERGGIKGVHAAIVRPQFRVTHLFHVFLIVLMSVMVFQATAWAFDAKIVPLVVGGIGIALAVLSLLTQVLVRHDDEEGAPQPGKVLGKRLHMDIASQNDDLPRRLRLTRAAEFFGWLVGLMVSMATIGLLPSIPIFVILFMRLENREPWKYTLPQAVIITGLVYFVFDKLMAIPWPPTLLGDLFPALKFIPSV